MVAAAAASRPNFDDRSGNKQQLIDLLLFDTDEDQEEDFVRGAWAKKAFSVGFLIYHRLFVELQSVTNS